ncbi:unnamed protein product, partial [Mesorhabditis spiculigera]
MPPLMVAASDAVMRVTLPDAELSSEIDIQENGVFVGWRDDATIEEQQARHLLVVQRRHMEEMYADIERALQKGKAHGIPDAFLKEGFVYLIQLLISWATSHMPPMEEVVIQQMCHGFLVVLMYLYNVSILGFFQSFGRLLWAPIQLLFLRIYNEVLVEAPLFGHQ